MSQWDALVVFGFFAIWGVLYAVLTKDGRRP